MTPSQEKDTFGHDTICMVKDTNVKRYNLDLPSSHD